MKTVAGIVLAVLLVAAIIFSAIIHGKYSDTKDALLTSEKNSSELNEKVAQLTEEVSSLNEKIHEREGGLKELEIAQKRVSKLEDALKANGFLHYNVRIFSGRSLGIKGFIQASSKSTNRNERIPDRMGHICRHLLKRRHFFLFYQGFLTSSEFLVRQFYSRNRHDMFYGQARLFGKNFEEAKVFFFDRLMVEDVVDRDGSDDPSLSPQRHTRAIM